MANAAGLSLVLFNVAVAFGLANPVACFPPLAWMENRSLVANTRPEYESVNTSR